MLTYILHYVKAHYNVKAHSCLLHFLTWKYIGVGLDVIFCICFKRIYIISMVVWPQNM